VTGFVGIRNELVNGLAGEKLISQRSYSCVPALTKINRGRVQQSWRVLLPTLTAQKQRGEGGALEISDSSAVTTNQRAIPYKQACTVLALGGAADSFLDFLFCCAAFVGACSLGSGLFARCALGGFAFFLGESSGIGHFFSISFAINSARWRGGSWCKLWRTRRELCCDARRFSYAFTSWAYFSTSFFTPEL
jgi:hypothetical protein